MKLLNGMVLLLVMASLILSSIPCYADESLGAGFSVNEPIIYDGEIAEPMVDKPEEIISETDDTTVTFTGNRWATADGDELWEYRAELRAINPYDTSWHQQSQMTYTTSQNSFYAMVTGTTVLIEAGGQSLIWTPQVLIGDVMYPVIGNPITMDDMYSNDYESNTIKWDYGICTRYLRVIDGVISEFYVFNSKPTGDINIAVNIDPSSTLESGDVYAMDAKGTPLAVLSHDGMKSVTQDAMNSAIFPITIDPTVNFEPVSQDGYGTYSHINQNPPYSENFASMWNASGTVSSSGSTMITGWYMTTHWYWLNYSNFYLYRAYPMFNTSALWGASISSATVHINASAVYNDNSSYHPPLGYAYLYRGKYNESDPWALPPTYPHVPVMTQQYGWYCCPWGFGAHWVLAGGLTVEDFNMSNYIGGEDYVARSTVNVTTTGWYSFPLNASGLATINTSANMSVTGWLLRIERERDAIADWNGSDAEHYFGGNQYVSWDTYDSGVSNRPYLEVTYIAYAPPVVRTDTASQIGMETARLNGYLQYDGGHPCSVGLLIKQAGTTNYSIASEYYGDIDSSGWVDVNDYYLCEDYVNGSAYLSDDQRTRADLNHDLVVNSSDSTEILEVVQGALNDDVYHRNGVETGELFGKIIYGLTPGVTYNYSTVAWHEVFNVSGTVRQFTTLATMGNVSNLVTTASCTEMSLTWTKANGSTSTMIRWRPNSYPTDPDDGTLLCDIATTYYYHTGLTSGTSYYYSAWGVAGGNYSAIPAQSFETTTACGGTGEDVVPPPVVTVPNTSSWFAPPTGEGLQKIPGYEFINQMADAIGMPHGTWWFLLSMGFAIVVSMWVFFRSQQILLAFITMCSCCVAFALMGTAPWWILFIFSVSTLGFSWKELR